MMTAENDESHRPGDDSCAHCESQPPSALQRATAAAMQLLQRAEVIRGIVLGATVFLAFVWFQLTSRPRETWSAWAVLALVACTIASFLATIFTDPGRVPPDWRAPGSTAQDCETARSEASLHHRNRYACRIRFCATCNAFKPPRSHHCSACKRCSLRMSHHCAIAACCVGLFNLKQYFLWLFYSSIGVVVSVFGLLHRLVWDEASLSASDWWLVVAACALHVVFAPTCAIMFLQTFFGLVHNNTKIEIWERHWAVLDAQRRGDPAYQYPYDRGTSLGNVIEVFGTNPLAWWVPVYTGLVSGLDYGVLVPINSNAPAKAIQTV